MSKLISVSEVSQTMSNAPTLRLKRPDDVSKKLVSAEDRVRELEAQGNLINNNLI